MPVRVAISSYVAAWADSPFRAIDDDPWLITQRAETLIRDAVAQLGDVYRREDGVAVHRSALVETGAVLKAPVIVGAGCFIGAGAYLRGGVFLDADCIVGSGSEVKTSLIFRGTKLAHLNFVGDSILGGAVNIEAGAVIANYRNEFVEKAIRIRLLGGIIETGVEKFGALVGDGVRIGANAAVAPGAVLAPGTIVPRLSLLDQHPDAEIRTGT